jgi:hypothetical protein
MHTYNLRSEEALFKYYFRWGHWIFQLIESFHPHYSPGVDSVSNRNEYQESSSGLMGGRARKVDNLTANCEPIV